MRPALLDPLFAALTSLQGIGPKLAKLFARLTDRDPPRVVDLLFHLPTGTIDRRARPKLRDVVPDTVATVLVTVDRHRPPPPNRPRAPYQIYASDETGDITLTYFNARKDFLEKLLPVGERRYLSGTTAFYDGMLQMVHPDHVVSEADVAKLPLIQPVYPLTEGLGPNVVRKAAEAALGRVPVLPEWQDEAWLRQQEWPAFREALAALHHPDDLGAVVPETPAWSRLAYDELLAGQLALMLVRASQKRLAGRPSSGDGRLARKDRTARFPIRSRRPRRTRYRRSTPTSPSPSACSACCKAMSARARPWWRCSRLRRSSRLGGRPR